MHCIICPLVLLLLGNNYNVNICLLVNRLLPVVVHLNCLSKYNLYITIVKFLNFKYYTA